jgi:ribonuclease P protein component
VLAVPSWPPAAARAASSSPSDHRRDGSPCSVAFGRLRRCPRYQSGGRPPDPRDGSPCSVAFGRLRRCPRYQSGGRPPDPRDGSPCGTAHRTPRCGFAAAGVAAFPGWGPDLGFAGGVVLPQQSRMRSPEEFKRVMRSGRRARGATLSGHLLLATHPVPECPEPKVGFVVSRAVGSAVVRNRVKRRLRELMRGRVASLPGGCLLVLRAHPAAAGARQADLAADLDLVLGRLLRRQVGALRQ